MTDPITRRALGAACGLGGAVTLGAATRAVATPVDAARYGWRNVVVGGGGFVPGVVFSRVRRGLAYLRSDMGGAYQFDAGAGRWVALQDDNPVSSYMGVESIAPDPVDADRVYAAVGMHRGGEAAILRSEDRGATWSTTPVPFRMGGNEDGRGLGERLAVDPHDNRILWFGSRHDGLQRSTDRGASWRRVDSFPVRGRGLNLGGPTNAGLSFVVLDPRPGLRRLYVGAADEDLHQGLWRSDDAGRTWSHVAGSHIAGAPGLSPVKAEIDDRGVLFVTWCRGMGPNGITGGAVTRLDGDTGEHRDISPPRPDVDRGGGFMGVALDRARPGVVLVSTVNRWVDGDTLWRSTDDGAGWTSLRADAVHDVEATPFLYWGNPKPDFGWWMAALAIDPFDGDRAVYATGATIYETRDLSSADRGAATHWKPWVEGIEQTAVITLASPPGSGPRLLTGFGDISGFAHTDFDASPRHQFRTPVFANTNQIDYAGEAPLVVVRSGTPHEGVGSEGHDGGTIAWSEDGGLSWRSLGRPRPTGDGPTRDGRNDLYRDAPITVSADGATFVLITPQPVWSDDRGTGWRPCSGLPLLARPVADRKDPHLFYALDFATGDWFVSTDRARSFVQIASRGLPAGLAADRPTWRERPWPLKATPGREGELWYLGGAGLHHSTDGGQRFVRVDTDGLILDSFDIGAPAPGAAWPSLYAIGTKGGVLAVWRSDDRGRNWSRINDARHEWGRRFRTLAADQRQYGRVYVATDGRGVFIGEPEETA